MSTATAPRTAPAPTPRRVSAYDGPTDFPGMEKLAVMLSGANTLPAHLRRSPADVLLYLVAAQGLGVTVFSAIQNLYPTRTPSSDGTEVSTGLASTAAFQRGLMHAAGYKLAVVKLDAQGCLLSLVKPGEEPVYTDYTLADAQQADLVDQNPEWWRRYPEQMLFARCSTKMANRHAAEVVQGLDGMDEVPSVNWTVPVAAAEAAAQTQVPAPAAVVAPPVAPAAAPVVAGEDDEHERAVQRGDRAIPEDAVAAPVQPPAPAPAPVAAPAAAPTAAPAPAPAPAARRTRRAPAKKAAAPKPGAKLGVELGAAQPGGPEERAAQLWADAQTAATPREVGSAYQSAAAQSLLTVVLGGKTLKTLLAEHAAALQSGRVQQAPAAQPVAKAAPAPQPVPAPAADPQADPQADPEGGEDLPVAPALDPACVCEPFALMANMNVHRDDCPAGGGK